MRFTSLRPRMTLGTSGSLPRSQHPRGQRHVAEEVAARPSCRGRSAAPRSCGRSSRRSSGTPCGRPGSASVRPATVPRSCDHLAQRVHDGRRVQLLAGTAGCTSGTRRTSRWPRTRGAPLGRRVVADLHQAHDLVGRQVHVPRHRAPGRALAALVAFADVDAGYRKDGLGYPGCRRVRHSTSLTIVPEAALSTTLHARGPSIKPPDDTHVPH